MSSFELMAMVVAGASAFVGASLTMFGALSRRERGHRRRAGSGVGREEDSEAGGGFAARIVGYACGIERRLSFRATGRVSIDRERLDQLVRDRVERLSLEAGVAGRLGPAGFREARARIAFGCAFAGALVGAVLSVELAMVLALACCLAGFASVQRALKSLSEKRLASLEHDLPEMLEVVALGLRSGLSFDRSFALYHGYFDTVFSRECASAQRAWSLGLLSRDEALKQLADRYESQLLSRTVDSVVRSLRFGTSLAEAFEAQAAEARVVRRARREERVAKAPVKMMIPTGTLILPAMLLVVLGPVLLELVTGF